MAKKHGRIADDDQEWEDHLIIRFPQNVQEAIREYVTQEAHASDRLSLNFNQDLRTGTITFDKKKMPFTLYDLPTITEVHKTLDKITLYKVADICQMIVCSPSQNQDDQTNTETPAVKEPSKPQSPSAEADDSAKEEEKSYQWSDGLCPPMKNARKRRFRKMKKKKYMDIPEVEKELKRLLRADLEAQSVSWEVLDKPEEKEAKDMPEHQQRVPQPSTSSNLPPTPTVVQFEEAGLPNSDEEKSDEEFVATITEREAALKSDDFLMDLHLSDSSADDDDATMMMDDGNSRQ